MHDQSKHTLLYVGSPVAIQRLQLDLEEAQIPSLVKNNFESGINAGFYGGSPIQIELFIYEEDLEKASPILEQFKSEMLS